MNIRLTVLCENSVGRPNGTIGEHGFACFIDTPAGKLLCPRPLPR
jgi:7,8-dihydropterin-6-yl-methyl-4-(beta-D-ribofuranosyl)aminobenzene 5'-phosphate synthase